MMVKNLKIKDVKFALLYIYVMLGIFGILALIFKNWDIISSGLLVSIGWMSGFAVGTNMNTLKVNYDDKRFKMG